MPFRDAISRLAVADARRFELQMAAMLEEILKSCADESSRSVIREIISEETDHLQRLETLAPLGEKRSSPLPPEEREKLPAAPDTLVPPAGSTCEMLREVLKKEEASVTFYALLAERTPIPAIKDVFKQIADAERGHVAKLSDHVHRLCQRGEGRNRSP